MVRRSILALIGAAPVAAVMPQAQPGPANFTPGVVKAGIDFFPSHTDNVYPQPEDGIHNARMRLEALRRLKNDDLLTSGYFGDTEDVHVESMRSWSPAYRVRARREHGKRRSIRHAELDLERAIKMSIMPDWVRRYM